MAVGWLRLFGPDPATPAVPSVMQEFSFGGEFENLMALALFALDVGDPYISIRIDGDAVRHYHQAAAEIVQQFAGLVEFENGVELGVGAGAGDEPFAPASFGYPDVAAFVDGHSAGGTKGSSFGNFEPAADRAIGIGRRIGRRAGGDGRVEVDLLLARTRLGQTSRTKFRRVLVSCCAPG